MNIVDWFLLANYVLAYLGYMGDTREISTFFILAWVVLKSVIDVITEWSKK